LEHARGRLEKLHQRKYQTDSETEQSGYDSSGYDLTPSQGRKVYSSPFNVSGGGNQVNSSSSSRQQQLLQTSYFSSDRSGDESAIESGPSFNESLHRFRTATSADAVSGGANSPTLKFTSRSQTKSVLKSVEEQRTMITRNSQKSYHIE
jgi:hypothetical protein